MYEQSRIWPVSSERDVANPVILKIKIFFERQTTERRGKSQEAKLWSEPAVALMFVYLPVYS